MSGNSFFGTHLGTALTDFARLGRDQAGALVRGRIPDLLYFVRCSLGPRDWHAPRRTVGLATSLETSLASGTGAQGIELQSLHDRIVTDSFLRSELDRDQNVYLGPFFTRVLTRATPDVVFQPKTHGEIEMALAWARQHRVGIATRGAGTTAMGGAVPSDGGLLLEMSRFDSVHIDRDGGVAVIGAGARLKSIHAKLAAAGFALKTYPSNLGGTLAGWFSAGGLGLNSFDHGPVQNQVRALSMVLPRGEHVRLHDDGRLDVLSPESRRLVPADGDAWLAQRGYPPLRLASLAQTEGQLGVILTLSVQIQRLPRMTPFFVEHETDADAITFARWVADHAAERGAAPANLKFLSAAHVAAVRRLRGDTSRPAKPAVYADFESDESARRFESRLAGRQTRVESDTAEAERWLADRFRPQQTKRLGPGFLAAEILLPARELGPYLERATKLAARAGVHLESEAYFFGDGRVLALPGWLTRGPRPGFMWELLLAPALLDLAIAKHRGRPYVLGRWQSPYFPHKLDRDARRTLRDMKKKTDPRRLLNPGVYFAPAFRIPGVQGIFRTTFPGGVRAVRRLIEFPLTSPILRSLIGAGHVADKAPMQSWRAAGDTPRMLEGTRDMPAPQTAADRDAVEIAAAMHHFTEPELVEATRGCVNCGECNSVCPVFDDAKIRLPQMLTHLGESLRHGGKIHATGQLLLDLCMRCGNCQEVCQADIPHLPLYEAMEKHAGVVDEERRERHVAILASLRHSERYREQFLQLRPGGYLQRTPASLPGEVRFVLFRAENDSGPSETCIHCGACVSVCPTSANLEFQEPGDVRRITTDLNRCIGCGTCVEVCPANHRNQGRTLRVMEAPTVEFFEVFAAFEGQRGGAR